MQEVIKAITYILIGAMSGMLVMAIIASAALREKDATIAYWQRRTMDAEQLNRRPLC